MASPDAFETDDGYHELLALVAHEFLHLWHVKRVRPAGLVPLDYARENHTRLLWLFEGGTSYFDSPRAPAREARLERSTSALRIGDRGAPRRRRGRFAQSLEEASFDAWIKLYRPDEHTPNSTVSYYRKGAVACLLLDLAIRARSAGAHSLDDVMRHLWRAYGATDRPVPEEGVEALVAEATGVDVSDVLDRCVRSTEPLPYEKTFAPAGFGLRGKRVRGVTLGLRTCAPRAAAAACLCPRCEAAPARARACRRATRSSDSEADASTKPRFGGACAAAHSLGAQSTCGPPRASDHGDGDAGRRVADRSNFRVEGASRAAKIAGRHGFEVPVATP